MRTENTIKNALVCDTCIRVQVVEGKGYWFENLNMSKHVKVIVDVVRCEECYENSVVGEPENTMMDSSMNMVLEMIKDEFGRLDMVNLDYTNRVPYGGKKKSTWKYGNVGKHRFASRQISMVRAGITYAHSCYSLSWNGIGDPHSSFIRHGPYPEYVDEYYPMPFKCVTSAICYSCKRTIVCESMGTFHREGIWMYKTDSMCEILVTFCALCEPLVDKKKINTSRMLDNIEQTDEYSTLVAYLPSDPVTFLSSKMEVETDINKVMAPVLNHCKAWSVDAGMRTVIFPHSNFFTHEMGFLDEDTSMIRVANSNVCMEARMGMMSMM